MERHQWYVTTYLLLSLPTVEGFGDRYVEWHCKHCSQFCTITGDIRLGTPLYWPEWWDQLAAQEQRQMTPEARSARQQLR